MEMKQTKRSEMLAHKLQLPVNQPKEIMQHSENGKNFTPRIYVICLTYTHLQCKTIQHHLHKNIHIYVTSLTTILSLATACCTNTNPYYERNDRKTLR
jgi:hypothetical protein